MAKAGVLFDSAPLEPVSAATTVRVRDGETLLTDGPYAYRRALALEPPAGERAFIARRIEQLS